MRSMGLLIVLVCAISALLQTGCSGYTKHNITVDATGYLDGKPDGEEITVDLVGVQSGNRDTFQNMKVDKWFNSAERTTAQENKSIRTLQFKKSSGVSSYQKQVNPAGPDDEARQVWAKWSQMKAAYIYVFANSGSEGTWVKEIETQSEDHRKSQDILVQLQSKGLTVSSSRAR